MGIIMLPAPNVLVHVRIQINTVGEIILKGQRKCKIYLNTLDIMKVLWNQIAQT